MSAPMIPRSTTIRSQTIFSLPAALNCQSGILATSTMARIQKTSAAAQTPRKNSGMNSSHQCAVTNISKDLALGAA